MNINNKKSLPEWTFRGGSFRSGFNKKDVPTKWIKPNDKWKREELIPYGKATPEYRKKFYLCPECQETLEISETEYHFECFGCSLDFIFSFGGLIECLASNGRYTPSDF